jgi:hypothetical protein
MNTLSTSRRTQIVAALVEGASINSIVQDDWGVQGHDPQALGTNGVRLRRVSQLGHSQSDGAPGPMR